MFFRRPLNRFTHSILVFALISTLSLIGFSPSATRLANASGSIAVNSLSDNAGTCAVNGTICLRNAIATAVGNASATTITFSVSGTITAAPGFTVDNSSSNPITIDGSGQSVIIDGQNTYGIFSVNTGAVLTLNALTIQHGYSQGGGAVASSGIVTITNSVLSHNGGTKLGGAIDNTGTLVVSNTTFSNNIVNSPTNIFAGGGGVLNINGTATISNSVFSNNAVSSAYSYGGAAYNEGGTLTIQNSTLTVNNSGGGGGVWNSSGTTTITDSTLSGNSASYGAGAYNSGGTLSIDSSTISGNLASASMAGIYNAATLLLTNNTITGNTGTGVGNVGGAATLSNNTIAYNTAGNGGGIYNNSTLNMLSNIVAANTATGTRFPEPDIVADSGMNSLGHNLIGALGTSSGFINGVNGDQVGTIGSPISPGLGSLGLYGGPTQTLPLLNGSPAVGAGNCAGNSGVTPAAPASTVDQRRISRHSPCDIGAYEQYATVVVTSTNDLGGMCPDVSNCTLRAAIALATVNPDATTIKFNVSGTITVGSTLTIGNTPYNPITIDGSGQSVIVDGGHQIQVFSIPVGGTATINALTIQNGFTASNGGGITNAGLLTVTNSTLSGNSAAGGGAIYNTLILTLTNDTFTSNHSAGLGGALENNGFSPASGRAVITSSTFSGNSALDGAGIDNYGGYLTLDGSTLSGNIASVNGGGIATSCCSTSIVNHSTLSNNSAATNGGGVANGGTLTFTNSTLANNLAGSGGGVQNTGIFTISNVTLSGNTASSSGGGVINSGGKLTLGNSTISGNSGRSGGGVYNDNSGGTGSTLNLLSDIIAGNTLTGSGGAGPDAGVLNTTLNSVGHNLIGDGTGSGLTNGSNGDQIGTSAVPINPNLSALNSNGGPTQTMAINNPSPAIGTGNCGGNSSINPIAPLVGTDQRGVSRQGPCDVGAFESNFGSRSTVTPTSTASATATMTVSGTGTLLYSTNTPTNTATATATSTTTATASATSDTSPTATATSTATSTPSSTNTPTATATGTLTATQSGPSLVVNSVSDNAATCAISGTVCLRNVIAVANSDPYATTITFSVSGTITIGSTLTIGNTSSNPITIDGSGQSIVIDGGNSVQGFSVNSGAVATLKNLTIQHGHASGGSPNGGGVFNNGTLTINNCTITNNTADYSGGGLENFATLTLNNSLVSNNTSTSGFGGGIDNGSNTSGILIITNSTLSGNHTSQNGGGIYNNAQGTLTISNSTLSGNAATGYGGGMENYHNTTTMTNTTVSGNTATNGSGGGVENDGGTLTISNSTLSGNTANSGWGGGLDNWYGAVAVGNSTLSLNASGLGGSGLRTIGGSLNLLSSIVAGNTGGQPDITSGISSLGHNLIGNGTNSGLTNGVNGDQVGTSGLPINPKLGPLASNGGPTQTMAVLVNSSAINGGDCHGSGGSPAAPAVTTDQRGIARVNTGSGLGCDIGAYESHLGPVTPTSTGTMTITSTLNATTSATSTATATATSTATSTGTASITISPDVTVSATKTATATATLTATSTPTLNSTSTPTVTVVTTITPSSTPLPPHIDTIGIFRAGTFYLKRHNSTGNADLTVTFSAGTRPYPIVGDWTGSGVDTVGVFDRSNGKFSLCTANDTVSCANSANQKSLVLGVPNDMPLSGRWQNIATSAGVGVFRPSNGLIYLKNALTTGFADYTMVLGLPGDQGLAGDWNGKNFDSPGVYRPTNSTFYLSNQVINGSVFGDYQVTYGIGGDSPVAGDWIVQGHDGIGLFRQSNGLTYLKNVLITGYADNTFTFGIAGDVPIAGHWQAVYPPIAPAPVLIAKTAAPPSANGSVSGGNQIGD